ncbi:tetratricopeptide repeat protein [Acuticoccus sp. M5D2P5]|uniref:tetratricopeptide repeat protein n=1 Tax=Acuticoccus kalidii TaxID=2910977 RepID=UPI001F35A6BD|nr:tetratricopeptide repeat protein [Acuticoccus kalidii]MCF3933493.1 tetratricopeptide repeat protein [Acuticoccus kalidii]
MRTHFAAPVVVLLATALAVAPATSMPRLDLAAESGVVTVQNRFLPRLFGDDQERDGGQNNAELRLQELEAQVRMLTGQVEQLTFTVRRLEQAIGAGAGAPSGDRSAVGAPGPGTPPRSLGSLPVDPGQAGQAGRVEPTDPNANGRAIVDLGNGPIDLSAINQGAGGSPSVQQNVRNTPPPAANTDSLQQVRNLQRTGRYQMAAAEARKVLTDNPTGPVAGEARYLLGEAMMAQGDYRNAANLFLENYTSDPNGARAPQSLLKLGAALNGLGEKEAACSSLAEFFGAYPNVDGQLRAEAERERQAADCA